MSGSSSAARLPCRDWASRLAAVVEAPWDVAEGTRAAGKRVIGIFGHRAPRELVLSSGMHPVRLRPMALARTAAGADAKHTQVVPDGLSGELSREAIVLLELVLTGSLPWIDGLLIGRDTEAHLRLFYVIRELAAESDYAGLLPPFAFSDVLKLPLRTSALYNRARMAELGETLTQWAHPRSKQNGVRAAAREPSGLPLADGWPELQSVIADQCALVAILREIESLRADRRVAGTEALLAHRASEVLLPQECRSLLQELVADTSARQPLTGGVRTFLTGSELEHTSYALLEEAGLALVGDDHSADAMAPLGASAPADPIGWIADRYQFSPVGAARAGLTRVRELAAAARASRAEAVLQIVLPDDEASAWELAELRAELPELPVVSAALDEVSEHSLLSARLKDAALAVREEVKRGSGTVRNAW